MTSHLPFDNSYLQLPDRFYTRLGPTPVSRPGPIRVNHTLAEKLGIDPAWLSSDEGTEVLAGNRLPAEADPIATVYAGHQFGGWSPQLGDGRAILLGEMIGSDGERYDIQLKGSGPTPYSRGGDGRAPLGPVLREYVVSEAMAALGVPTTRSLAAVTTGDPVFRQTEEPGAVLTRVAKSHIRIGTFQFFLARQDFEGLRLLLDYVIKRHYPAAAAAENPAREMFDGVIAAQAALLARWQLLGFIHGVMNTDNMLLSGETIDYGPCAFMDTYHAEKVFSSIDHQGRYAYINQPGIAHWNLARLAQCLLPLMHEEQEKALTLAQDVLDTFPDRYQDAYSAGMACKLGLSTIADKDASLASDLLELMQQEKADFTLAFRRLSDLALPDHGRGVGDLFEFPEAFDAWLDRWRRRVEEDAWSPHERQANMYRVNPVFIPRNHQVAAVIDAAVEDNDFAPFHQLVDLLEAPRDYDPRLMHFARPPRPTEEVSMTFCGT